MDYFINQTIIKDLKFPPKGIESFLDQIEIDGASKDQISLILEEAKRLPAALKGYHGSYKGGLYDHTILVANCAYQIWNREGFIEEFKPFLKKRGVKVSNGYNKMNLSKIIQTALCHDFGKIPYYAYKKKLINRKIYTTRRLVATVSSEIKKKFELHGKDYHVEEAIAVMKRYLLPFDDEIFLGIIFHHGRWSKYRPFRSNKLSELIHIADMIASHYYKI